MTEVKVQTSYGEFVLKRPTKKERDQALLASRVKGKIDEIAFMINILPKLIKEHPFKISQWEHALDDMDASEADKLYAGLQEVLAPREELKKKQAAASEPSNSESQPN